MRPVWKQLSIISMTKKGKTTPLATLAHVSHSLAEGRVPTALHTTPAADFCRTVRVNRCTLSHGSLICSRSPEASSIAFHAQPLDLPPVPLMDVGFAIIGSLARHRRPLIQFLSIRSRVCYALLSFTSRFGPCASLSLHLHQAVNRTFTSKLPTLLGTPKKRPPGFVREASKSIPPRSQPRLRCRISAAAFAASERERVAARAAGSSRQSLPDRFGHTGG
jgi:hypothetical protein